MTAIPSDRLSRTVRAYLEQELSSPSAAIAGFLDIMIEDARTGPFADLLPDLERMQTANRHLGDLIVKVCAMQTSPLSSRDEQAAYESRLRHDLRTPLNAIKGYSEMLIEDLQDRGGDDLVADLDHIHTCTDQMLARIDRLSDLGRAEAGVVADRTDGSFDAVAGFLRSVAPLGSDSGQGTHGVRGRILVVDDEPLNRDLLFRRLTREGHTVEMAAEGGRALAMTGESDFDLILLDMIMPGLSGFDVLCRLKSSEATRHIPVIVVSALDEIDSVVRCVEVGAEDYLPKNCNPTLLKARIAASLEKKHLRDREENLLLNILPRPIVNRMRGGERGIADGFESVTILFCDLVGFTPLAAKLSPTDTVALLSQIFSTFDRSVARWGVEKIKTIGDSYMAAGGIPERTSDHAERIARLAVDMLADVEQVSRLNGHELTARIGIHSGEAVAGVIGTNRLAYDVWGDTVNTAARMESHGVAGRIHISEVTRRMLGDAFAYEARGPIEIKGKNFMETYFLTGLG